MSQENALPLGRRFLLSELPGHLAKWLEVPSGRQGVALDVQGRARTWPSPGRYKVLGAGERVRGRGAGLVAGWVPAEAFPVRVEARGLLSHEGELLEASWVVWAEIQDPVRFFRRQVIPAGTLHSVVLAPDLDQLSALSAVTRQYQAEDLVRGAPAEGLAEALRARLSTILAEEGLKARTVPLMIFWYARDQVKVQEKMRDLQEEMEALKLEGRMAEAEAQTRWAEFVRELEEDTGVRVQEMPPPEESQAVKGETEPEEQTPSLFSLAAWKALITGEGPQHPLLARLFAKEEEIYRGAGGHPVPRPGKWWWLPRTAFILFSWIIGVVATQLIFAFRGNHSILDCWDLLTPLWGFVLGVTLEGIYALYEKREKLAEASWVLRGYTRVDDLVRQDRERADALVRGQTVSMLSTLVDLLREWRSRVFRTGDTDAALRLRTLERQAETLAEDVQRPDFGRPPYLEDTLKIGKMAWDAMLDYDEELLLELHALLEMAQVMPRRSPDLQALASLEQHLADFRTRFQRRAEALRPRGGACLI